MVPSSIIRSLGGTQVVRVCTRRYAMVREAFDRELRRYAKVRGWAPCDFADATQERLRHPKGVAR